MSVQADYDWRELSEKELEGTPPKPQTAGKTPPPDDPMLCPEKDWLWLKFYKKMSDAAPEIYRVFYRNYLRWFSARYLRFGNKRLTQS